MMKNIVLGAGMAALLMTGPAAADERREHYEGKPAETTEQALANLAEYNAQLASIIAADELDAADMNEVHQLTYTLENALARIDAELEAAAAALESVHLASEAQDAATVRRDGRRYLETSGKLLGQP